MASFFTSVAFAQDSTSIKITLPKSEKWSTDSVKIYNFLQDKWTYFDKIDTSTNSCFIKFPCERAIEQNIYVKYKKEFNILILPNDDVEIAIDEEGKLTFSKGKTYRENQITYNKLEEYWDFNFYSWFNIINSNKELEIEIYFYGVDSMKREIINGYEIATKDFAIDSTFNVYFRNELDIEQYSSYKYVLKEEESDKILILEKYVTI